MLLIVAALAAPAYLLLDRLDFLPVSLRDRPWPFALVALALALMAMPRRRVLAVAVAIASSGALGWAAWSRYRLPPSSHSADVGQELPDITLPDETGRPVRLRDHKPLLLVWFRGSWCPYCKKQLADLAAEMKRHHYDLPILAVAPDPQAPLLALRRDLALPFSLLSDPDRQLVNRCELSHCVAIADGNGVVRWEVVSGNWEKDLPARALLQAAYRQR